MSSPVNWPQLIKRISKEEREASKPCTWMTGTVTSLYPIEITVKQKLVLEADFLVIPERLSLSKGDSVCMIRQQGGQRYYVADIVKGGD